MQTLHGAINGHDTAEVGESEEQHETKKKKLHIQSETRRSNRNHYFHSKNNTHYSK